jgi:uncharacterized membrane protein
MEWGAVLAALVVPLLTVSIVLSGVMAGFFFAYSASVVLALDTLTGSAYTTVMQSINEVVLNPVFGVVFFGAVAVPAAGAAIVLYQGDWAAQYGLLFLAGTVVYLLGTFAVTMRIHVPMNEALATWSPASPPENWAVVRTRWARWNHVRTTAAAVSFVLYLAAIVSFGA